MKTLLTFIIFYLFHTLVLALTTYSATYSAHLFSVEIGTDNRTLDMKDNAYLYQSNTKTNRKGRLFYKNIDFKAKSIFTINDSKIIPISYKEKNVENGEIEKDINIKLKNKEFDRLSLFIALPNAIKNNSTKTNFNFTVNDGEKIETHHYQIITNNKKYVTVLEKNQDIKIKFSKEMNYFPVFYKIKNISFEFEKFN